MLAKPPLLFAPVCEDHSLSKTVVHIARPWSWCKMLAAWSILPTGHILIIGRSHEVPDNLQLMGIAVTRQYGLTHEHFTKNATAYD